MPTEDAPPAAGGDAAGSGWWHRNRHAVTAALGNTTALGLGFVYLRRWPHFTAALACTSLLVLAIWRSEAPPARLWFVLLGISALVSAGSGWRAGRRAAYWDDVGHVIARLQAHPPSRAPFWIPVSLLVLAAYAAAYGWVVAGTDRIYAEQTEHHRAGDCEAAVDQVGRLHWGHHAFATARYEDVRFQAETCRHYLSALELLETDRSRRPSTLELADWRIAMYLDRPDAVLDAEARHRIRTYQAELLLQMLHEYDYSWAGFGGLVTAVQESVEDDPDSLLATRTATGLEAIAPQWRADVHDAARVCHVSRMIEHLVDADAPDEGAPMPRSGPVATPLRDLVTELRAEAAVECGHWYLERSEELAANEPDRSDAHREHAAERFGIVVDELPDHERADEAAAMLEELRGREAADD